MLQRYVLFNGVLRREIMEGDRSSEPTSVTGRSWKNREVDVLMLYACLHDSTSLPIDEVSQSNLAHNLTTLLCIGLLTF